MLARRSLAAIAFVGLLAVPAQAQTVNELIQEGRFEEAATLAGNAGPEAAEQAARAIFQRAYTGGHQQQDFGFAIRGFVAAKSLVDMSDPLWEQLTFWHGFSLYSQAIEAQAAETLATAQVTLPMFEEARELFAQAGDYPASINVSADRLVDQVGVYIEIQQAVIRRSGGTPGA